MVIGLVESLVVIVAIAEGGLHIEIGFEYETAVVGLQCETTVVGDRNHAILHIILSSVGLMLHIRCCCCLFCLSETNH